MKRGRKSKLTPELIEEAYKLIKSGLDFKTTAWYLGISESAFYKWMREGEKEESGLKKQFFQSIKKAESEAIARNVMLIQKHAQEGNWQAAAWWLERRYSDEWGKKDKINLGGYNNVIIKIIGIESDENESE